MPTPVDARSPRTRRTLLVLAAIGIALWIAAVVGRRETRDTRLGRTVDERVAAIRAALPAGTSLDSARRFLSARGLDFAQGARTDVRGGGVVLSVFVVDARDTGALRSATQLQLEFDGRRRPTSRRRGSR